MHTEANSATHCDPVQDGNVWLAIGSNEVIELVFKPKEIFRFLPARLPFSILLGKSGNVTASTEGFCSCAGDEDDVRQLGFLPFLSKKKKNFLSTIPTIPGNP